MKFKQIWLRSCSAGLLTIGLTGCSQVDAGNLGIVTKWGEIQDIALQEGIHFRTPVKTQIINISTRVHKMEASATASSQRPPGRVDENRVELPNRRGTDRRGLP